MYFTLCLILYCLEKAGGFEGDIILTPEQKYRIEHGLDLEPTNAFGASKSRRWTNGVMPYVIASSLSKLKVPMTRKLLWFH